MIHVHRDACTAGALTTKTVKPKGTPPATRAERELAKAIQFYSAPKPKKPPAKKAAASAAGKKKGKAAPAEFKFSVYKDKEIAAQLRSMFSGKCAYCDSQYRHVTSTDIEHFRPKAAIEVNGKLLKPGYFWLAATWENLYPSCPLCNRIGDYSVASTNTTELGGKGCKFPLLDEKKRVRKHALPLHVEETQRLLLDPCADMPEDVLAYLDTGAIVPRKGLHTLRRRRAEESIRIYGLFRAELVEKRKEAILTLEARLRAVDHASEIYNWMVKQGAPASLQTTQLEQLDAEIEALKAMFKPTAPYLGLLRFQVRKEIGGDRAKRLKRRAIDLSAFL